MLGDSVNSFSNVDLDRFYLSTMAGYFPMERNAFDVTLKRCHTRRLRQLQTEHVTNHSESNVIDIFSRKESDRAEERANIFAPHRRHISWQVHYLREVETA